ncbi:TIGR03757 family integrating conjugative element protein [Pseudomonas azotoformans]|uniref:TIGR03757 family integrating conjugative element protein n=1 Tax=Pseudomonas azotoformans TaxID=47878 RepID=UPI0009EF52A5|nr:TIGR03757 family integrating conjugative element protein [Pseudomonas azotoformans]
MTGSNSKPNQILRGLLPLFMLYKPLIASAETLIVTDQAHPISAHSGARIIHLDSLPRIEVELSHFLPSTQEHAPTTIQHYLSTPTGKRLQYNLNQAHLEITDAWSLGIEKIPAVVVDRRYVVYGEMDVAKAVELINQHRSSSQ